MSHPIFGLLDVLGASKDAMTNPSHTIERTELDHGLIVSTVLTNDMGHETAILDDGGTHPVERYPDLETAKVGHERWVAAIKGGQRRIRKLGYKDYVEAEDVDLKERD